MKSRQTLVVAALVMILPLGLSLTVGEEYGEGGSPEEQAMTGNWDYTTKIRSG